MEQAVAGDAPQGLKAVAPTNLLPLRIRAPGIADRHLVHTAIAVSNLGRNLWLEPEPILLERWEDIDQDFATKHLVACFHVGQIQVREAIG